MSERIGKEYEFVGGVDTHLGGEEMGKAVLMSCPVCGAAVVWTESNDAMTLHAQWHERTTPLSTNPSDLAPSEPTP
jgi:hypothetical protein